MNRVRSAAALLLVLAMLLSAADLEGAKKRKKRHHRTRRQTPVAIANFDTKLPVLGTRLATFPAGPGQRTAAAACVACHSADMVCQQRLTGKQWTAEVGKMVGWGAVVPPEERAALLEYLVQNFGPDNDGFSPVITRPVGR